jgi:5,10-methylenetetrahydromethanopterin reductase
MKLSLASLGAETSARFLDHVKLAEFLGFHAYFHNDKKWAREVFSRLGAATQVTTRLGLGTSIVDPYTRHAALLAQASATLAELAPGRFRLIIGAGSHFDGLPGYRSINPVAGLREAAELIKRMWRGETVTIDGEVVKFHDGALDWKPTAVPALYVASRGPRILKLAGEVADGVLIGSLATAPGIAYAKEHIALGLKIAQRGWNDIRVCSWLYVCIVEEDGDPVPDSIKRAVSFALWGSRKSLSSMLPALAGETSGELQRFMQEAPQECSPQLLDEISRLTSPELFESLALVGSAAVVVERIKALAAAGIQEIVIWPFLAPGQDMEEFIYTLAQDVLPHFSERSAYTSR